MEYMKTMTTAGVLERGAETAPDKTAVVDGKQRKTYRELNQSADALAAGLSGLGFRKGDRVAIYMPNCMELIISFFALQKLGVIVVWVNAGYREAEARFIMKDSGAKGILITRRWDGHDFLKAVVDLKTDLAALESIIVVGKGERKGVFSFSQLMENGSKQLYDTPSMNSRQDLSMLLYTSGTTGKPKGAMITQFAAVNGAHAYSLGVKSTSADIFIGLLPMTHSYGCGAILIQPILLCATVVLLDQFEPEKAFSLIEKEKVTLQLAAPAHYILELNHPARKNYDLSSLRAGLIAGQIAPEGLISRVEEEMNIYLTSFWGASEVGPGLGIICPYPSPLSVRERYIGKPINGTTARIVDPVTREEVADEEMGELTLQGWHVMRGYWNNPEETHKQVINGWLHMGDIVSREKEGFIKIYGRTKDLINRGGFKIYPHELESLIVMHPKVEQVCIVATPNPVLGESVCACIIQKGGEAITLDELREFLSGKVARHKLPNELCMMDDFPRLTGGVKINKFGKGGLTEMAKADLNREDYRR